MIDALKGREVLQIRLRRMKLRKKIFYAVADRSSKLFFLSPLIIAKILSIRMKWRCLLPNLKGFLRVKLLTQWFIDIVQHHPSFYQLYVSFHATEGNWKFHGNEISNFKRLMTPRYATRIQDSIGFKSKLASERLLNDCFEYHNYPVCCCMVDHDWAWITAIYKTDWRSIIPTLFKTYMRSFISQVNGLLQ